MCGNNTPWRGLIDLSGAAKAWKGRGAGFLIVCVHELLECVEPWLSLTLSFFLSLVFFSLSFFFSSFFLSFSLFSFFSSLFFFFFEQARSDTFLKQGYSFGCLELCSKTLSDFPPHLEFCVKVKCAMPGSPFKCVPTPKSIKVFS